MLQCGVSGLYATSPLGGGITHGTLLLTGCHLCETPVGRVRSVNYAGLMSRMLGLRCVRNFCGPGNGVWLQGALLIVALAAGCVSSGAPVSDERAEVLADVVERWIVEIEELKIVLEGVTDEASSIKAVRDVRTRVSLVRSIKLEAGEWSDDDETYVQAEFGDRLGAATILLDAERRRLGIDGRIGNDIPELLAALSRFDES